MTVPIERIETRILSIRGHRVLVDTDLAEGYGVPTKVLNQAAKRNALCHIRHWRMIDHVVR
jgi:ORF6N domain